MSFLDHWFRKKDSSIEGFRCATCRKWHNGLPLDFAFDAPIYWDGIPEGERKKRGTLGTDTCVIDDENFFVRGLIQVPVLDMATLFSWGAWVSLSQKNFKRALELWDDPRLLEEPHYFGWLSNSIPGYPETLNLKTEIHWCKLGRRPAIILEPTDHPLAVEQRDGITRARIVQIAEIAMHSRK